MLVLLALAYCFEHQCLAQLSLEKLDLALGVHGRSASKFVFRRSEFDYESEFRFDLVESGRNWDRTLAEVERSDRSVCFGCASTVVGRPPVRSRLSEVRYGSTRRIEPRKLKPNGSLNHKVFERTETTCIPEMLR